MAWNPFKAIGGAIGRVFGRGESAPSAPTTAPEPAVSAVSERRGGLSGLWDRVTGADRRREEETERERQVEERLRQVEERVRQVEERERQLEERERQVEERQQQIEAREQAIPPAAPVSEPVPTPAPSASTAPERELPKFASDTPDYLARDERAFGTDSDIGRELEGTVAEFIMDRGGLQGLSADAREWLQNPTVSGPFSEYWHSGGFSADQVLAGMQNITNIKITEGDDGEIQVEFDYDAEVDGYEVHGHAS